MLPELCVLTDSKTEQRKNKRKWPALPVSRVVLITTTTRAVTSIAAVISAVAVTATVLLVHQNRLLDDLYKGGGRVTSAKTRQRY